MSNRFDIARRGLSQLYNRQRQALLDEADALREQLGNTFAASGIDVTSPYVQAQYNTLSADLQKGLKYLQDDFKTNRNQLDSEKEDANRGNLLRWLSTAVRLFLGASDSNLFRGSQSSENDDHTSKHTDLVTKGTHSFLTFGGFQR